MKVLILSISAGGGHIRAAEAVKSYTLMNCPNAHIKIIDTFKYINPVLDKVVIGSYLNSIKLSPSIFGKLYKFSERDDNLISFTNKVNEIIGYRILSLIRNYKPDIIYSTHPFSNQMLSVLKAKYNLEIPAISILTDYAAHSFWIHPNIDAYVVSNDDMKEEMIHRGVPESIIYPIGIPVNPGFLNHSDRVSTLYGLGLDPSVPTVLLMGGSLGIGKITSIYEELANLDTTVQIVVITGKNKKLYSEITRLNKFTKNPTFIIGFTKEVNKYMQAADIIVTKPGGLTITEALISHLPLIIFSPIPGPELENSDFLVRHHLAHYIDESSEIVPLLNYLLNNGEALTELKENTYKFARPDAGNEIYKLMEKLIKGNEKQKMQL